MDEDKAPLRSALIGAVAIAAAMQAMTHAMSAQMFMALYASIHILALGLIVPIAIVLMTRRSPAIVTTSAVVATKLPLVLFDRNMAAYAVFLGVLVWIASTQGSFASADDRREPGVRMKSHWWMPLLGFVLLSAPYVVRASYADPDVPVGAVTAIFTVPVALALLGIWIPAFSIDAIAAFVLRWKRRKG